MPPEMPEGREVLPNLLVHAGRCSASSERYFGSPFPAHLGLGAAGQGEEEKAPAIKSQAQEQIQGGDDPSNEGNKPLPLCCSSLSPTLKSPKSPRDFI